MKPTKSEQELLTRKFDNGMKAFGVFVVVIAIVLLIFHVGFDLSLENFKKEILGPVTICGLIIFFVGYLQVKDE